ncbi:hypothetical protein GCM10011393_20810 [Sphingopyxis bauzanensis]|nr:hypothetical protein GCM10011393_20810 [Sphingopyxis bauzanensis]
MVGRPSVQRFARDKARPVGLVDGYPHLKRCYHAGDDIGVKLMDRSDIGAEVLRPDDATVMCVAQFDSDGKLSTRSFDCAGQHVSDAKDLSNLPDVKRETADAKCRCPCDDEKPS